MKQAKPLIFTVRCNCTHIFCSWRHLQEQSKCCFLDQASVLNLTDSCFYLGKAKSIHFKEYTFQEYTFGERQEYTFQNMCYMCPFQNSAISTAGDTDLFFLRFYRSCNNNSFFPKKKIFKHTLSTYYFLLALGM